MCLQSFERNFALIIEAVSKRLSLRSNQYDPIDHLIGNSKLKDKVNEALSFFCKKTAIKFFF